MLVDQKFWLILTYVFEQVLIVRNSLVLAVIKI